jgi:gliding motility-associated-like protein
MKKNYFSFFLFLIIHALQAQRPFDCGAAYMSVGEGSTTRIYKVEVGEKVLSPKLLLTVNSAKLNGFGFRRQDKLMYACKDQKNADNSTSIYRVDADGKAEELAKLPFDNNYAYYAGDVSPDGRYYTILGNGSTPPIFYVIDLLSPTYAYKTVTIKNFSAIASPDIAYSVNGDKLFVEDNNTQQLLEIDLDKQVVAKQYPSNFSGSLLFSGMFGFDCGLYGYVRSSGLFIRIESDNKKFPIGTATALNSIAFSQGSGIDACSCPQNVKFTKKASKVLLKDSCSRDYRFVFNFDNECNIEQNDVLFSDIFPKDFVIKSIDYQPFGGVIQGGVGYRVIEIQGMKIPARKDSIVIVATLTPTFQDSVFKNQAILKNLKHPDGSLYSQVSDNPLTLQSNDSTVLKAPIFVRFSKDTVSICKDSAITLKPITVTDQAFRYQWSGDATSPSIKVKTPGLYLVSVTTDCFMAIDSQWVIDRPLQLTIGDDVTVFAGDSIFYQPDYQHFNPIIKNEWTISESGKLKCVNCYDNVVKPFKDPTVVKFKMTDALGCVAEDEARIAVKRNFYVPNSFSPNDDGINDRFFPVSERDVRLVSFEIYNRYGDLVYKGDNCRANDYDCAWDGRYQGFAQKSDIFTYRIEVDFGDGELFLYAGDIAIVK